VAQRKFKLPGPSSYKPDPHYPTRHVPKSDTPRLVMLDHARWMSKQTPGPQYKLSHVSLIQFQNLKITLLLDLESD